jgi:hypothetical protein
VSERVTEEYKMMTHTIENRVYEVTESVGTYDALKDHLISRGFDGKAYNGISRPVGRQRKTLNAVFFRSAKTGEFVSI